jgi:membrane-associated phospholipid phosphatase
MIDRFPFTIHETVPVWLLLVCTIAIPAILILLVCLFVVPGSTTHRSVPASMIWKRKLWEVHVGLLGLIMAVIGAWFITNGMKIPLGKPRPDLLSRCQPDLQNMNIYIVGGIAGQVAIGQLVSAHICTNTDRVILEDGFKSFPSGHSSSSAAGLIYLSLFLASKFSVSLPLVLPGAAIPVRSAFPSRLTRDSHQPAGEQSSRRVEGMPTIEGLCEQSIASMRLQAAAPPIYLLFIVLIPFFGSIFIASSLSWHANRLRRTGNSVRDSGITGAVLRTGTKKSKVCIYK